MTLLGRVIAWTDPSALLSTDPNTGLELGIL